MNVTQFNNANEFAYLIFSLCGFSALVLILLRHLQLYTPIDTLFWVLISVLILIVFKLKGKK
jgi:hypothetical protein